MEKYFEMSEARRDGFMNIGEAAAASGDAPSGARSVTAYGWNSRTIAFTASNIAAWTIARFRDSSGGLNGAAAVVLSARMFQSRMASASISASSRRSSPSH